MFLSIYLKVHLRKLILDAKSDQTARQNWFFKKLQKTREPEIFGNYEKIEERKHSLMRWNLTSKKSQQIRNMGVGS